MNFQKYNVDEGLIKRLKRTTVSPDNLIQELRREARGTEHIASYFPDNAHIQEKALRRGDLVARMEGRIRRKYLKENTPLTEVSIVAITVRQCLQEATSLWREVAEIFGRSFLDAKIQGFVLGLPEQNYRQQVAYDDAELQRRIAERDSREPTAAERRNEQLWKQYKSEILEGLANQQDAAARSGIEPIGDLERPEYHVERITRRIKLLLCDGDHSGAFNHPWHCLARLQRL